MRIYWIGISVNTNIICNVIISPCLIFFLKKIVPAKSLSPPPPPGTMVLEGGGERKIKISAQVETVQDWSFGGFSDHPSTSQYLLARGVWVSVHRFRIQILSTNWFVQLHWSRILGFKYVNFWPLLRYTNI